MSDTPTSQPGTTIRHDTSARHLRKYTNRNPIHRLTLGRFFDHVAAELRDLRPQRVLEFGCGEGFFLRELRNRGVELPRLTAIDLREDALQEARRLHPGDTFLHIDLFDWECPDDAFDLVIASQVLEHIPDPEPVLRRLVELSSDRLLLTVPCEPWFRLMNLARGRDLKRLGNHPEHVNCWSLASFKALVEQVASVEKAYRVFPFTVLVARTGG